jgi:hypothetical protein
MEKMFKMRKRQVKTKERNKVIRETKGSFYNEDEGSTMVSVGQESTMVSLGQKRTMVLVGQESIIVSVGYESTMVSVGQESTKLQWILK